ELLIFGLQPHGLGEIKRGEIALSVDIFRKSACIVRGGAVPIEANGVGEIRNGTLKIILLDPAVAEETHVAIVTDAAAQIIVSRAIRSTADRPVEIGDGLFGIFLGKESLGTRFVAVDEVRIE